MKHLEEPDPDWLAWVIFALAFGLVIAVLLTFLFWKPEQRKTPKDFQSAGFNERHRIGG
jgi:hypothetical protein